MSNATVPLHSITKTHIWQQSKYRFFDNGNSAIRSVISSLRQRTARWEFEGFLRYYEDPYNQPQWEAINKSIDDYYYPRWESVNIIQDLLHLQFYDLASAIDVSVEQYCKDFMQEVYDICEKRKPKVNTLELIGPASSGKSYFADMICAFYLNVGHMKNFNRNEAFPMQSCTDRRIILWNEAQAEVSAHDTIKLILGGDPCPANIKYQDIQTINRTPVIITANRQYIPRTAPFNDRMIRYQWIAAPFLKEKDKKPHPLCYIDLLRSYNIID